MLEPLSTKRTTLTTPKPCYWCEHDGIRVLRVNGDKPSSFGPTFKGLLCDETSEGLAKQITEAKLTPLPLTPRQQTKSYLEARFQDTPGLYEAHGGEFVALSALESTAEVIRGTEAIVLKNPDWEPIKTETLRLLRQ